MTTSPRTQHTTRLLDSATKQRLREAADRAEQAYPGAIGELLRQELLPWMVFGHHLGSHRILRVADTLLDQSRRPAPDRNP